MKGPPSKVIPEPSGIQLSFPHIAGTHCSSSSIADILRFDGFDVTEAMVFGLGSGLGFVHVSDPAYSPTRSFNGRALDLEGKFYRLFGHQLGWAGEWKPEAIAASLAAGRPLLAQTDIAYLPYYDRVHFPMHGIVVTGWDGKTAHIADTFSPVLQEVAAEHLRAALVGDGCPLMLPYRIAGAPKLDFRIGPEVLARSIAITAREMLEPSKPGSGIPAMRQLVRCGKAWSESPDWQWSARYAYQGIEKRGTGGGGFRALYANFLGEAAANLPWIRKLDAESRMRKLASDWSALALLCKSAFVESDPSRLEAAAQALDNIADLEAVFLGELQAAAAERPRFER